MIRPPTYHSSAECLDIWASESVSQVVSAAVFYLLPSLFYCLVAYVYYCQTGDSGHPASLTAQRGSAIRLEARGGYNPLPLLPPADARPAAAKRRTTVSPRSYHQTAGVAVAPVASGGSGGGGSSLSPGPPSFSVADPRAYQSFRLSAGPEDDAFI